MKYDTRYNFNGKGVSKVTKLRFSKQEQEEMDLINQGKTVPIIKTIIEKKTGKKRDIIYNHKFTFETGHKRLLQLYGGHCISCHGWPDLVVSYNKGDEVQPATMIQRYCNSCYSEFKTDTYKKQHKRRVRIKRND